MLKNGRIRLTATLERGDSWLVQINKASYIKTENDIVIDEFKDKEFKDINFPKRVDNKLRLGPKESTSTEFIINADKDVYVIAKIVAFPIGWPVPSRSYCKIFVPK